MCTSDIQTAVIEAGIKVGGMRDLAHAVCLVGSMFM